VQVVWLKCDDGRWGSSASPGQSSPAHQLVLRSECDSYNSGALRAPATRDGTGLLPEARPSLEGLRARENRQKTFPPKEEMCSTSSGIRCGTGSKSPNNVLSVENLRNAIMR
jgi:hypothetical protein